ncbi:MAG TPA: hypothetical protein PLG15_01375 [Candidatus Gastranaerophilaceae bacterium]|nr:hypothetical protein [Candidatus Gastranaerophilaceae bacterium]HPT41018.1 hypothetical protein [Candidatus Gastranaerophilaceae bacterium]
MKKIISVFLALTFSFYCVLPVSAAKIKVAKSQLEVREIQTHIFDTNNINEVFKAAINTLQDEGYSILNIEDELGYIQARKEYKAVRIDKGRMTGYYFLLAEYIALTALTYGMEAPIMADAIRKISNERSPRTVVVDSNVTIEPYGKKTKVRFTLIEKELENADGYSYIKSSPRKVLRIYTEPIYKEFFAEMDKSIFYGNAKL